MGRGKLCQRRAGSVRGFAFSGSRSSNVISLALALSPTHGRLGLHLCVRHLQNAVADLLAQHELCIVGDVEQHLVEQQAVVRARLQYPPLP